MIAKPMEKAINDQINAELYSFYLYLAMAAHFEETGFPGLARWMKAQAQEEMSHALKFFSFVHERAGVVTLLAIDQPKGEWPTVLAAFKAAQAHERHITKRINTLMDKAVESKDHATANFLQWFVKEQVEEEAALEPIVTRLEVIGDHPGALYYLDHELGKRGA
ncbi:MAG TPA: ferritin [Thermoanaerobaculaceae bacterium]|nr:ferritin [Thermoanaerobaculaceae bacterium]